MASKVTHPFPGPGGTDPDLPPSNQYPAWVRDAPSAFDPQDAAARARIGALPIRANSEPDPDGSLSVTVNRVVSSGSILPTGFVPTTGSPGSPGSPSGSRTITRIISAFAVTESSGGSGSVGGQTTLFTGSLPPPGQPYPYGHQHPHVHPATTQTPIQAHHSHFHRHDGRISDHSDYNLDQHSHPH